VRAGVPCGVIRGERQKSQTATWACAAVCREGALPWSALRSVTCGLCGSGMEVYHDMRGCGLAPSNPLFQSLMDLYVEQGLERPIEPADTLPFDWMAAGKDSLSNPAAPLPNIIDNSYIDLHGLSTVEARAAVLAALRSLDLAMLEQVKPIPLQDLVIVTGRGQNSTDGLPVVRHAVLKCEKVVSGVAGTFSERWSMVCGTFSGEKLLEELKISVVASPPQNQLEDGTQPPDETLPCIDGEGASTSRPTSAAAQQKAQNEHQDGMQAGGQSAARGDQHKLWNVGRVIVSKEVLSIRTPPRSVFVYLPGIGQPLICAFVSPCCQWLPPSRQQI
ncbi:hypothetical protein CYMTET_35588, partial [Cymbomonas tetramitiformis]